MLYHFILLSPCFVCLIWSVTLFCRFKANNRTQNILAVNMLLVSILFFILANYYAGVTDYALYYKLDIVDSFVALLLFPVSYFYFRSLTKKCSFGWKDFLWILPSITIGGSTALLYYMMGEENAVAYIRGLLIHKTLPGEYTSTLYRLHYLISVKWYNVIFFAQGIIVGFYAVVSFIRYRSKLNDFYSSLEGKSMERNYAVLAGFYVSLLFTLITSFLGRFFFIDYPALIVPLFLGWTVVYYFLCYQGSHLKYTIEELSADLEKADKEALEKGYSQPEYMEMTDNGVEASMRSDVNMKKKIASELISVFNRLIDEEEIFLQNELRLDDMARLMRTNRTYISRLINEEYNCSFSDFINRKRIGYAKKLVQSDHNITQEQVALQSGFSHPSTFSRTFKQQEGVTFREWQKKTMYGADS